MENYLITDNCIQFTKPSDLPNIDSVTITLSKETVLKCAEKIKQMDMVQVCSSDEVYQKVIEAENKLKTREEKEKWYKRAYSIGICPKCGGKIITYNPNANIPNGAIYSSEYKCTICSFNTWIKNE